jgi:hypothetical protein
MSCKDASGHQVPEVAFKHNGPLCHALEDYRRAGTALQRAYSATQRLNIKHGRQTKDKLEAQRHAAMVGRRVMGKLKRLEGQLLDAGLMLATALQ